MDMDEGVDFIRMLNPPAELHEIALREAIASLQRGPVKGFFVAVIRESDDADAYGDFFLSGTKECPIAHVGYWSYEALVDSLRKFMIDFHDQYEEDEEE